MTNAVFVGVVGNNSPELKEKLREKADQIRTALKDTYFSSDGNIHSGAAGYDSGAVYYKRYSLNELPSGADLAADLEEWI